jgi:hypothetical protein
MWLPGSIIGKGYESRCLVEVSEITDPEVVPPVDVRVDVVPIERQPPSDGDYQLIVDGETYDIRYSGGRWIAGAN